MKKVRKKGAVIMAAFLSILAAFGSVGCAKTPDPEPAGEEPASSEPVDGATTNKTDPDAPKTIASKEITDLYASFFIATRWREGEEHVFHFRVAPDESGALTASEELSGARVPADGELLASLQEIIDGEDLASRNGVRESNASLAPEFQGCEMKVNYASGESLKFAVINDPCALWAEKMYDVFAEWFSEKGDDSLYPEKETSQVTRLRLRFVEDGLYYEYGGINVGEEKAIGGETYLLEKEIYDSAAQKDRMREFILFPEDFYERVTEIIGRTDLVRNYDFSRYDREAGDYGNHEQGYFGMGDLTTSDGEEDSEDLSLTLHVEFESGKRVYVDTGKESEIRGIWPLVEDLLAYLDPLFTEE